MRSYSRLLRAVSLIGVQLAFAAGSTATGIASFAEIQRGSPPTEVSTSDDLPANFFKPGSCDFPIRVETRGKSKTIAVSPNRSIVTSPGLKAVVTNLDDPSQVVTLSVTGAFHQSIQPNGDMVFRVTGRNLLGDPEAGFVLA